jgi:hypothetical protein
MSTIVNEPPFVPETVQYIRFFVLGQMSQKVLIEPSAQPDIGLYTTDPDTAERTYTGVFPALTDTSRWSSNVSYTNTGLDNLDRPAIIYSGSGYTAQVRTFALEDTAVVPNADGLSVKLASGIGLGEERLFVIELMNADKRVIGRREVTPEEGTDGAVISISVSNFYKNSTPELQGLNVVTLTPTYDLADTTISTIGDRDGTIYKVVVPADTVLNLTMHFPSVTTTSQSCGVVVYGEDGRIHARYYVSTEVPYAHTLPIFPTEKTLYIVTQGGLYNQSGRTAYRDFDFYSYGQLQDPAQVALQIVPVIDFGDVTPEQGSQDPSYRSTHINELPTFPIEASILWSRFHLAIDCDKIVISTLDPNNTNIADTMIVLYDQNGEIVMRSDGGYALDYSDEVGSLEATLTYSKLAAGTYYFATTLENGGTSNDQSLGDMDSINYSDVGSTSAFGIFNTVALDIPGTVMLSIEVFPDNNIYIDNSRNGCTIPALSGQQFKLRDNPADPFTRNFKCRFISLDDGEATVAGDPGFRNRILHLGEIRDEIDATPITLEKKGDWVDVVYDDKALAFQVAGMSQGSFSRAPWIGTLEFNGLGKSKTIVQPGMSAAIYPVSWFDGIRYNVGFDDGTRFTVNEDTFQSVPDLGEQRYEVTITAQLVVSPPDVPTTDDTATDRSIDLTLVLDSYPFFKEALKLSSPAVAPFRNNVTDGHVYEDNGFVLTLSGSCFVTALDDSWVFLLRNPYSDRTISFNAMSMSIREVPLQTEFTQAV